MRKLKKPVLEVNHVSASYKEKSDVLKDISFQIEEGEIVGLVGESGCGKSTLSKTILGFLPVKSGEIIHNTTNPQMIFQDPFSSLNPSKKIGWILEEPLRVRKVPKEERKKRVAEMLEKVGLNKEYANHYPGELSGGQRQRVSIAISLIQEAKFIIADEPVSALDVSIQAKIINLLKELQQKLGIAYIFISHDLSVVKHIADRVGVMYLGNMMEMADKKALYSNPLHPYTQALFSAIPKISSERIDDKEILGGDVPSPANPPKGCRFVTRCPKAMEICKSVRPELKEVEPGHKCACHLYDNKK